MSVHAWRTSFRNALIVGMTLAAASAGKAQDQQAPSRQDYEAARQAYAVAVESGELRAIAAAAEAALETGRAVLGESTRETAELHANYAAIRGTLGFTDSAREAYGRAIDIYREIDGENSPDQIPLLLKRAAQNGNKTEDVTLALDLQLLHAPDDIDAYAALAVEGARLLARRPALSILNPVLREFEMTYGESAVELVPILMALGRANATPDDPQVQDGYIERALQIAESAYPDDPVTVALLELEAGQDVLRLSRWLGGERYVERAVDTIRETLGPGNETTARAELALGAMYSGSRDFKDAAEALESAAAFFADKPAFRMDHLRALAMLIDAYEFTEDSDLAEGHEREFVRLCVLADNQEYIPLFRPEPQYPQLDISVGSSGFYPFRYRIDRAGRTKDAVSTARNGSATIMEEALKAVERFRYLPRVVNGEAVETEELTMAIDFVLGP